MIRIIHLWWTLSYVFFLTYPGVSQSYQTMYVDIDVTDVAYWEMEDRLVVCTNTDTTYGNSILIINPYTGVIESSSFIGSIPISLDLSHDQQWAYVSIYGANRVVLFDLKNLVVDRTITLGTDQSNRTYTSNAVASSSQSQDRFALVRGKSGITNAFSVALYDNGINQHAQTNSIQVNSLVFSHDERLFGGSNIALLHLITTGPQITSVPYFLELANFSSMQVINDFIYSQNGYQIDISGTPVIEYQFTIECGSQDRPVKTAVSDSLVFLIGDQYDSFGRHCMKIYESFPPYTVVDEFPLNKRISHVSKLITCGETNVALILTQLNDTRNKLAIMRRCTYSSMEKPVLTYDGIPGACYGELVTLTADTVYGNVYWSNGEYSHEIHIPFNQSGEYYYQIADSSGCLSLPSNTLNVDFGSHPDIPVIFPDVDTIEICTGEAITLQANGGPSNTNHWSTGSTGGTLTIMEGGTYALQRISSEGCKQLVIDSIVVIQRPSLIPDQPILYPVEDTSLCFDKSIAVYGPLGFVQYQWLIAGIEVFTDTNSILLIGRDHPGNTRVELRVLESNGCLSSPSENLLIKFIHPGNAPTISRNGNVLTASGTGTFQWFFNGSEVTGAIEKTFTVTVPGFYQVRRTSFDCNSELSSPYNFE